MQEITISIKKMNPIDTKARISKLQDLAQTSDEDLKLIHELVTNEKYWNALKRNQGKLRTLANIM